MPTFELAAFTVRPENEEALVRERPDMIAALKRAFPGALAAWLTREDDGGWLDIVLWRSRAEAERAAREVEQIPEVRRWFRHIAESKGLRHIEVVTFAGMTAPHTIDLSAAPAVSHDPGVLDREADVAGTRWALVEYSAGSGRREWCDTPHAGYVVSGAITYSFEDDSDPLVVGAGEAFALPTAPRHRGTNEGDEPARLFIIDALPGA